MFHKIVENLSHIADVIDSQRKVTASQQSSPPPSGSRPVLLALLPERAKKTSESRIPDVEGNPQNRSIRARNAPLHKADESNSAIQRAFIELDGKAAQPNPCAGSEMTEVKEAAVLSCAPDWTQKLPHELKQQIVDMAVGPLERGQVSGSQINLQGAFAILNRSWRNAAYDLEGIEYIQAARLYQQGLKPNIFETYFNDGYESYTIKSEAGAIFNIEKLGPLIDKLTDEEQSLLIDRMTTQTDKSRHLPPDDTLRANVRRIMPFFFKFSPNNQERLVENGRKLQRAAYYDEYGNCLSDDKSYENMIWAMSQRQLKVGAAGADQWSA